jgi:uncharacterized iron-regulated membrane protein
MRAFFRNLHLIAGLVIGLVAAAVGLSGSILTFREEIERAFYEPRVAPQTTTVPLQSAYAKAQAVEAERRRVSVIVLPAETDAALEFSSSVKGARNLKDADQLSIYVNPYSGELVGQRHRNASFIAWLRDLHFALFAGTTGLQVNGWLALVLIFIVLTGLVLWVQTYVKGKALAIHWKASWKRLTWDLHRVVGSVMAVFLVLVAATGAYYPFRETMQKLLVGAGGAVPARGTPAITPTAGATPLTLDEIIAKARPVMPDARLAVLRPPATPTQAWAATFHRGWDEGESADSGPTAYLDPYSGAALRFDDARTMPFAGRLLKTMEPLHYGKFIGLPQKLFWFLLGLTPAFFFGSGILMWWNRTRGARRTRKESHHEEHKEHEEKAVGGRPLSEI